MRTARRLGAVLAAAVVLALVFVQGCGRSSSGPVSVQLDDATYQIAGPYAHENMTVFLLCSNQQDQRDFITLHEGLKDKVVKVMEQENAQVPELIIENQSDVPLFLQEGDRLEGGQQDRIIIASQVIPPKSGKMSVKCNCIEAGRWTGGRAFEATHNAALAPKDVRNAAKIAKDQSQVWSEVAVQRQQAERLIASPEGRALASAGAASPAKPAQVGQAERSATQVAAQAPAANVAAAGQAATAPASPDQRSGVIAGLTPTTGNARAAEQSAIQVEASARILRADSSLNTALDAAPIKKVSDEFANALSDALKKHPDAVGVAIVINGQIEEVNIYPNHKVLGKLYPRLVQSYAVQAAAQKDQAKDAKPVAPLDVKKFMTEGKEESKRTDDVQKDNRLQIRMVAGEKAGESPKAACVTEYQGAAVHRQIVTQPVQSAKPQGTPMQRAEPNFAPQPAPPTPPAPK